jgi:hypothetical protein
METTRTRRNQSAVISVPQPAEQVKDNEDNHEKAQYATQSPAPIVSPAVAVVAPAAEQQNEHDNEQDERHLLDTPPVPRQAALIVRSRIMLFLRQG